ncbi:TadE/TadG family type IV pilus assembly protein [Granulosicoccus sp. 3-233]|uniref:TadE/TadG family type IV pilus assembly protein n=1 Tax=Granulosicoccus sp. 3-233 TaxID=3417969 RepID=UPI003D345FBF
MIDPRCRESGSALVEASILMVVMVPLVFAVAMIGNLIDLKQTSEQAGRYAAWEATVYPSSGPGGSRPASVKERFFGDPANVVSSRASEAGRHSLWGESESGSDRSWSGKTAISIDESTVLAAAHQHGAGESTLAMHVGEVAGKAGTVLDGLSGNSWGLSSNGLVRSSIGVQVKTNDWLTAASSQGCGDTRSFACLQSSSVILVDGWSASSDDQARRRVRSLVPASALQPLGDVISNVGHIPMFKELKQLDGAFGHVDMNVLPEYAQ